MSKASTPNSIIHPKIHDKLLLVSGMYGLGKTSLAMTLENPTLTGMFDFDLKGEGQAGEIGMAWYQSPKDIGTPDDYDVANLAAWLFDRFKNIPDGLTHLIIDNATWAEIGFGHIVGLNPAKYGLNPTNVAAGRYGGVNPGIKVLWANIFSFLQQRGIKTVTCINHMSSPWVNGAPVANKKNIKGNKVFHQISSLVLIMVPGDPHRGGKPPAPSGLIVKEAMPIMRFVDDGFELGRALPTRLPVCDWPHINAYFETPANFNEPRPGEVWSVAETHSYGEWLSKEQIEWVQSVQIYSEEDEGVVPAAGNGQKSPPPPKRKPDPPPAPIPDHWSQVPANQEKLAGYVAKLGATIDQFFASIGVKDWDDPRMLKYEGSSIDAWKYFKEIWWPKHGKKAELEVAAA